MVAWFTIALKLAIQLSLSSSITGENLAGFKHVNACLLVSLFIIVGGHVCHKMPVHLREQPRRVASLLPPSHRIQGLNSGQAWLAEAGTCSPAPMWSAVLTSINLCCGVLMP